METDYIYMHTPRMIELPAGACTMSIVPVVPVTDMVKKNSGIFVGTLIVFTSVVGLKTPDAPMIDPSPGGTAAWHGGLLPGRMHGLPYAYTGDTACKPRFNTSLNYHMEEKYMFKKNTKIFLSQSTESSLKRISYHFYMSLKKSSK